MGSDLGGTRESTIMKSIGLESQAALTRGSRTSNETTVEYVFIACTDGANATSRFLVADEVGLGKTLVARG